MQYLQGQQLVLLVVYGQTEEQAGIPEVKKKEKSVLDSGNEYG